MTSIALGGHPDEDRTLVTIFLRGGADGLALVPAVHDDGYHRARPRLGVSASRALRLEGPFGLAPELAELTPGSSPASWPWCTRRARTTRAARTSSPRR